VRSKISRNSCFRRNSEIRVTTVYDVHYSIFGHQGGKGIDLHLGSRSVYVPSWRDWSSRVSRLTILRIPWCQRRHRGAFDLKISLNPDREGGNIPSKSASTCARRSIEGVFLIGQLGMTLSRTFDSQITIQFLSDTPSVIFLFTTDLFKLGLFVLFIFLVLVFNVNGVYRFIFLLFLGLCIDVC
jgi:hypothetical protein